MIGGEKKEPGWALGVGTKRGIVPPRSSASFFPFSLYSFWAVFIVGTSGTPIVGKSHRWFPLLIARERFKRLRSWSTLWVRPVMMSSLPAVATSLFIVAGYAEIKINLHDDDNHNPSYYS